MVARQSHAGLSQHDEVLISPLKNMRNEATLLFALFSHRAVRLGGVLFFVPTEKMRQNKRWGAGEGKPRVREKHVG